jgi:hypothetical protein
VTEVGLTGTKFEPPSPPEQQIPSPPSAVTAQELPAPKPDVPAPKSGVQAYIAQIKSFISADQLDPWLLKLKTELATAGTTTDQFALLLYLTASLTVQLSHKRNYNGIFGSQLNLLAQINGAGGITPAMANTLYEQAKAAYPQLYTRMAKRWLILRGATLSRIPQYRGLHKASGAEAATFKTPL